MSGKQKKALWKILVSAALFAALMIAEKTRLLPENRLLLLALYAVPYFLCGWSVVRKALLGIKNRQVFDESFLMTVATVGAVATGEYSEAVAVMLFYQVGEWFQDYAVGRSRRSITELMDIVPEIANRESDDGSVETIDPDDVEVGDTLVIRPGERIPVDGTVIAGESLVNTAALTGESVPRSVRPGEAVISGCINGEGLLKIRAEKAFEDSTVTRILELVETAAEKKSRTENFITRFARWYTPAVVIAAVLLALIPSLITGMWSAWIYRACAFLVISCPCALVISVPLAFFGGVGAASAHGVLVKGSNYLEVLSRVHTVVSDKTGTLTRGDFRVTELRPAPGVEEREVLSAAALAEGMSTHPIAISIREALSEREPETEYIRQAVETENYAGRGLSATVEGRRICVGNAALMASEGVEITPVENAASTVCYVSENGRYLGAILIRDEVKGEAPAAIAQMKRRGVKRFVMLTGDRKSVGEAVGGHSLRRAAAPG